jgi:hypothetical protein
LKVRRQKRIAGRKTRAPLVEKNWEMEKKEFYYEEMLRGQKGKRTDTDP